MIQLPSVTPVDQMQVAPTWTVPVPPLAGKFMEAGETENVHSSPAWLTWMIWSAIAIVPLRAALVGFRATENPTRPVPLPVCPR
jgi:hypothetical protein